MAKRRYSMFRRNREDETTTGDENVEDSRNGDVMPAVARSDGDLGEWDPADDGSSPEAELFDREATTDEFAAVIPLDRPPEPGESTEDWRIDTAETDADGPGEEAAATKAAEERAIEEIVALEDDLERAKREGAARVEALEVRLGEAERRATEAEARTAEAASAAEAARAQAQPEAAAAPDPAAAKALEEEARTGAAQWLRDQVQQVERAADARVKAAARDAGADPEKLAAEHEKRLAAEIERVKKEADERVRVAEEARAAAEKAAAAGTTTISPAAEAQPPAAAVGPDTAVQEALTAAQEAETRATAAKREQPAWVMDVRDNVEDDAESEPKPDPEPEAPPRSHAGPEEADRQDTVVP